MGKKGGKNRAKNLSKERRSEIARIAGLKSAKMRAKKLSTVSAWRKVKKVYTKRVAKAVYKYTLNLTYSTLQSSGNIGIPLAVKNKYNLFPALANDFLELLIKS